MEYTAENMDTVMFPLKVDETKMDWEHGMISIGSIDGGVANIGYAGGGAESIPAEYILRPTPGMTGWFK